MQLVNSCLAQIDEGILNKLISGSSTTDSHQEDGGNTSVHTTKGGGSVGVVNGSHEYSKTEIDKFNTVYSENNSELIETALADYSLDVLLKKLSDDNFIKLGVEDWADGDFIYFKDEFKILNFDQLKESTKEENLNLFMPINYDLEEMKSELNKLTKTPLMRSKHKERIEFLRQSILDTDNFGNVLKFASYCSVLFPDTVLFKIGHGLSMCSKQDIRINTPLLAFLSQTSRKINLLGIILTKKIKNLAPSENEQLSSLDLAATGPAIFTDIMLDSFDLIDKGDYFIRPIAIYFD